MKGTLIKSKILEKYKSIRYFCFLYDIKYSTLMNYCSGRYNINSLRTEMISKICNALQCEPSDIGFTKSTKDYWYVLLPEGGMKIVFD